MNWGRVLIAWTMIVAVVGFTWAAVSAGAWGAALAFDLVVIPFGIFMVAICE